MKEILKDLDEIVIWMNEVDQLKGKPSQQIAKGNLKELLNHLMNDVQKLNDDLTNKYKL